MTAIHFGLIRYSGAASYERDHSGGNRAIGTFRPRAASEPAERTGAALCRFRSVRQRVSRTRERPPARASG